MSPLRLGKTEVTQGQWKKVMGNNPSKFQKGDDYPVEQVSWNDVQEFIRKLNAQSVGMTFRLPTEAEWEYSCRGGVKPVKYGTQTGGLSASLAKYNSKYTSNDTVRVGSFAANGLGLHDMSGNVSEWVQDRFDHDAYMSPAAIDPVIQGSPGARRVERGGGWYSDSRDLRCSSRRDYFPYISTNPFLGFRLVRTIENNR